MLFPRRRLGGLSKRSDLFRTEHPVAARRHPVDGQRPQGYPLDLFHRMVLPEKRVAQILLLAAAHPDFVPVIGGVAAGSARLPERFEVRAYFLAETRQLFAA